MNPASMSIFFPREVSVLSMAQIWPTGSNTYFLYFAAKSVKHVIFLISESIFDEISIALYFIILAPKFEHVFIKANCRVFICLVLYN